MHCVVLMRLCSLDKLHKPAMMPYHHKRAPLHFFRTQEHLWGSCTLIIMLRMREKYDIWNQMYNRLNLA